MAYISQVSYETATPEQKREFDDQIKRHGRITNMKKTLLHSIPSFKALMEWYIAGRSHQSHRRKSRPFLLLRHFHQE